MIDKALVINLVNERLDDKMFIVDVLVNERNVINVYIDSLEGLTIDQCVSVSRNVEHNLDREEEDFELHVSSPGLTESFKVKQQYIKYQGREVEIETFDSSGKLTGILLEAGDEGVIVETSSRERVEGHKKKQLIVKTHSLKYDEIKSAKAVISFK
jgi:ribosome maturation factor RimP